jgi:hypothetical protein
MSNGICARCLNPGDKSKCPLPGCQYRRFDNDDALDLLAAETAPDPLEEMAAGLCPECLNPLDGGDMSCISSECRFYGRVGLDAVERPTKRLIATGNKYGFTAVDESRLPEYRTMQGMNNESQLA